MIINRNPNIKVYQLNAFAECIIASHKDYRDWHYNSYIQLIGWCEDISRDPADKCILDYLTGNIFGYIPLLHYENYSLRLVSSPKEAILPMIQDNFEKDSVWYLFLDQFYTQEELAYQKSHYVHDILLHKDNGSNFEYVQFDNGFYSKHKVGTEAFLEGLTSNDANCLYKIKLNNEYSYQFSLETLIEMLKDYTYARDSRDKLSLYFDSSVFHSEQVFDHRIARVHYFGIENYEMLSGHMNGCMKRREIPDWMLFNVMYEHKNHMMGTILYCVEKGILDEEHASPLMERYGEIADRLYRVVYRVLQRDFASREQNFMHVIKEYEEIGKMEKPILEELIGYLEDN
ncbi:hypothetical protein [[Clostridium] polysaccharolyticum]|uniref:Butirosin biosynthesis protein H, N-terminal n=1 Tax=[Clostridium] polysaccharolyticum TaxID=29364 RepID=A0A1I0CJU5_9FIRM|nr:hypothetical protein [[Clostridium] polysaccharolyticum]SET19445.1 hypothetical protein SAMN04487772_11031 [[Clostridium] polysaccharolyticum]